MGAFQGSAIAHNGTTGGLTDRASLTGYSLLVLSAYSS